VEVDSERQERLNEVAVVAVRLEAQTGLPARLMIAQWAVESNWGAKPIGKANYFGMKKADRHTQCCTVATHEVEHGKLVPKTLDFADYNSLAESCEDYAWLITHGAPYAAAWAAFRQDHDVNRLAHAVLSVYATAQYGALALQIAAQDNVQQAITAAEKPPVVA